MHPSHGEVWLADRGMTAKTRPVVVLLADGLDAPRTLIIYVPITSQVRGSEPEIAVRHLPFLTRESVANVQAIGAAPNLRFETRIGLLPPSDREAIKQALMKACALCPSVQ
jgi:mRNA interferase MazF